MSETNPYSPPSSSSFGAPATGSAGGEVPAAIMDHMRMTRPWVLFLAIVGFVFTGLILLGGLGFMAAAAGTHGKLPWQLGLIYVLLGVLYIFPSLYMYRYATALRGLLDGGGMSSLIDAVGKQKSFWRLIGISTLVIMCLYGLFIVGAIVVGVLSASRRF